MPRRTSELLVAALGAQDHGNRGVVRGKIESRKNHLLNVGSLPGVIASRLVDDLGIE